MNTIIDRIRQIIDYKRVSERAFCKEIGVANGFMSKVIDVGCSKLNKILYAYPEFNPVWLLTGEGEMLRAADGEPTPKQAEPTTIYIDNPDKDEIIQLQRKHIALLEEQLNDFKKERERTPPPFVTRTSNTLPVEPLLPVASVPQKPTAKP